MSSSSLAKQLLLNIMITHGSLIFKVFAFQYTYTSNVKFKY